MKKFVLTCAILCAFGAFAFAGTERYSGKDEEVLQPAPPPCEWYRANEWDLSLWGTYAFPGNTGSQEGLPSFLAATIRDGGTDQAINEHVDVGHLSNDRFINRDGAWGGGADIKYFFSTYWALGVEGFVLDANDNIGGAGLGTFTFRYPIGCSHFAPYAFVGGGALAGGSHQVQFFNEQNPVNPNREESEFFSSESIQNKHTEAIAQFGGGLEIRLLRPTERCKIGVGLMADFAWNVVGGPDNNFGMGRFGVNFSY
jgi:hypothetical protein